MEQAKALKPPPEEPKPVRPPSQLFKLARRLSQKTTVYATEQPSEEAQDKEMPRPDLPRPRELETPLVAQSREHESGASSYASAEEPEEEEASSTRRKRNWGSITPSAASETEMGPESLDLQSHDPRPESVAMAGWAQGLGAPTASRADTEQPVLTRPLILSTNEKVMEAGQLIDSTLPFKYDVNETHQDQEFRTPKHQLPAWKTRKEFIEKLDGSRL